MAEKVATFRERFTELVDSSPKSRTTIAREFNVAKQTVSAWVTGQSSPRLPVVASLADYFGVSIQWLLGYDVPKISDKEEYNRYSEYVDQSMQAHRALGFISKDEADLVSSYRSLSPKGKSLLIERSKELELLYGKKSEDNSAEII